jgi:hypothetical protein
MIFELAVIVALIFLFGVLFYKQRREDISILQIESQQLPTSTELFSEKQPLIVRGAAPPQGLTAEGLKQIPRLASFPVGTVSLSETIAAPSLLGSYGLALQTPEQREQLAEELSIPIWAGITWKSVFAPTTWLGSVAGTLKSQMMIGGQGLSRAVGLYTLILPTDGTYTVSLLSKSSEQYLPTPKEKWLYRYPTTMSVNDTPLIAELKYIDIVLRPGTGLILPPHLIYSLQPQSASSWSAAILIEYHEPISLLAKTL